jgi:hypothetical protein
LAFDNMGSMVGTCTLHMDGDKDRADTFSWHTHLLREAQTFYLRHSGKMQWKKP